MELYYKNGVLWFNDVVGFDIEDYKLNYNSVFYICGLFGDMLDYVYMGGCNEVFMYGLIIGCIYDYDLCFVYLF